MIAATRTRTTQAAWRLGDVCATMKLKSHELLENVGDLSVWEVMSALRRKDEIIYLLRRTDPPGARDAVSDADIAKYYRRIKK